MNRSSTTKVEKGMRYGRDISMSVFPRQRSLKFIQGCDCAHRHVPSQPLILEMRDIGSFPNRTHQRRKHSSCHNSYNQSGPSVQSQTIAHDWPGPLWIVNVRCHEMENSPQIHKLHKLNFSMCRIPSTSSPHSIKTLINHSNFILNLSHFSISIPGYTHKQNKTTDNLKSNHLLSFISSASAFGDRHHSNWLTLRQFRPTLSHSPVQYPVICNGRVLIPVSFLALKK
jgi:hypothetical protein